MINKLTEQELDELQEHESNLKREMGEERYEWIKREMDEFFLRKSLEEFEEYMKKRFEFLAEKFTVKS